MRLALILVLVLGAAPALAQCPNGNCPFAAVPPGSPQAAAALPALPPPDAPKPDAANSAAGKPTAPPPTPPAVEWVVEGYKAIGYQWVKQPDHCFRTTDLKQAAEYEVEVMRYQDWIARSNVPALCSEVPLKFESPRAMQTPEEPPAPTFSVWVFHQEDGKWVKDPQYCCTTGGYYNCRLDALAYAKKVNAVPGWCATTNAPDSTRTTTAEAIAFHGPLGWGGHGGLPGNYSGTSRGGYPVYSEHGGRTIYRPHMTIRLGADADWAYRHEKHDDPLPPNP